MLWSRCTEKSSVLSPVARAKQLVTRRHVTGSAPLGVTTGHKHGRQEEERTQEERAINCALREGEGEGEGVMRMKRGEERQRRVLESAAIGLSILSQCGWISDVEVHSSSPEVLHPPTAGWMDGWIPAACRGQRGWLGAF